MLKRNPYKVRTHKSGYYTDFTVTFRGIDFYVVQDINYRQSRGARFGKFRFQPFLVSLGGRCCVDAYHPHWSTVTCKHSTEYYGTPVVDFTAEWSENGIVLVGPLEALYAHLGWNEYEVFADEYEFGHLLGDVVADNFETFERFASKARLKQRRRLGYR